MKLSPSVKHSISKLHIQQAKYHGRQFEGNQCRLLLKNVNRLQIPDDLADFKDVLIALRRLHSVCNDDYLSMNYVEIIDNFSFAWFKLTNFHKISTTPKLHIVLDHLCNYFDEYGVTLKTVSDELVESMHSYVEKCMNRSGYKVKSVLNPSHGKKLFRALMHVNCYNLKIKK